MATFEVFDLSLNDSTLVGFLNKVNSFTDVGDGGVIGIFVLLVVGVPLFLMMKGFGNERALGVAGFVTALIGFFLRIFGLISDVIFFICIILFVGGFALLIKEAAQFEQ